MKAETVSVEMTDHERQLIEDQQWAQSDPHVQQQYAGQVVVVYQKRVVGAGRNLREALDDARAREGERCPPRESLAIAVVEGVSPDGNALADSRKRLQAGQQED